MRLNNACPEEGKAKPGYFVERGPAGQPVKTSDPDCVPDVTHYCIVAAFYPVNSTRRMSWVLEPYY